MKRTIAGILLLVGLGAGSLFADDRYWSDHRHIERDRQKIAEDRRRFNAICITGITGLLIANAGSLNTDIAICSGIWIAFTIAMEMAIVIVIGSVTMMAVIGNGGRIRQMIGWERTWQFYHTDCRKLATEMGTMGHFGSTANQPTVNRQT